MLIGAGLAILKKSDREMFALNEPNAVDWMKTTSVKMSYERGLQRLKRVARDADGECLFFPS